MILKENIFRRNALQKKQTSIEVCLILLEVAAISLEIYDLGKVLFA